MKMLLCGLPLGEPQRRRCYCWRTCGSTAPRYCRHRRYCTGAGASGAEGLARRSPGGAAPDGRHTRMSLLPLLLLREKEEESFQIERCSAVTPGGPPPRHLSPRCRLARVPPGEGAGARLVRPTAAQVAPPLRSAAAAPSTGPASCPRTLPAGRVAGALCSCLPPHAAHGASRLNDVRLLRRHGA
jgi:hypothetical protein